MPKTNQSPIISIESLSIGTVAESIATSGGTIPGTATQIHCYPGAACHVAATDSAADPSATVGKAYAANEMFVLEHNQRNHKIFNDAGGDQTMLVAYVR